MFFVSVPTATRMSSAIVRRQLTLRKFIQMPAGIPPPPPQQASLNELWKKKTAASKEKGKQKSVDQDSMDIDPSPATTSKRKTVHKEEAVSSPPAAPEKARLKKRRVIDSDEEPGDAPSSNKKPVKSNAKVKSTETPFTKAKLPPPDETALSDKDDTAHQGNDEEGEEEESELDDEDDEVAGQIANLAAKHKLVDVDIKGSAWKKGDPIPYAALTHTFSLIEATTKRLEITAILTSFLLNVIQRSKEGDSNGLLQSVYLCINRLCPDFMGIELGIGESLLIKAIAESTGRKTKEVQTELKKEGDLGLVAMNSKNSQRLIMKPKPLTVPGVFAKLEEIAKTAGNSSQAKKINIITKLLAACQGTESKYIIRSLEGKLRIRLAERTVLVALAHAMVLNESRKLGKDELAEKLEVGTSILKSVYSELPSYDLVIPALLEHGIDGLKKQCKLTPGIPLKPMLAKPTKAIGEVLDRFEGKRFTCEYKYDGERAQVHLLEDGTVRVFSRNSEDMSKKYPDIIVQLPRCVNESTKSFVFDSEVVAVDKATGKLLPFQELSKRKRKDVKAEDITTAVCLFAFDLLYLNGDSLLHRSLADRRILLRESFVEVKDEFAFATSSDLEGVDDIQTFLDVSVKDGCEGLMVKMMDGDESFYEPSRRSVNWLKVKKDYLAGVGDSLDLVVVGAYFGKGKRTNVYGAFLLACFDSDNEQYQTICKIGTGFSDENLLDFHKTLQPLELEKPRGDIVIGGAKPDVWFKPSIVWEVLAADLSLSPIYTAAQGTVDERGISLRFPRYIRTRDDKDADDATGPEQIAEMYEKQSLTQSKGGKKKGGAEDDFW